MDDKAMFQDVSPAELHSVTGGSWFSGLFAAMGALVLGAIGFGLGGPIGAGIGAFIGGGGGWYAGSHG